MTIAYKGIFYAGMITAIPVALFVGMAHCQSGNIPAQVPTTEQPTDTRSVAQVSIDFDGGMCAIVREGETVAHETYPLGQCGKAIIDVLIANQKKAPQSSPAAQ